MDDSIPIATKMPITNQPDLGRYRLEQEMDRRKDFIRAQAQDQIQQIARHRDSQLAMLTGYGSQLPMYRSHAGNQVERRGHGLGEHESKRLPLHQTGDKNDTMEAAELLMSLKNSGSGRSTTSLPSSRNSSARSSPQALNRVFAPQESVHFKDETFTWQPPIQLPPPIQTKPDPFAFPTAPIGQRQPSDMPPIQVKSEHPRLSEFQPMQLPLPPLFLQSSMNDFSQIPALPSATNIPKLPAIPLLVPSTPSPGSERGKVDFKREKKSESPPCFTTKPLATKNGKPIPIRVKKKKKNDFFHCPRCPEIFVHQTHLLIHIREHNGQGLYKCDVCDKRFAWSSALNVHKRTHTGEKPFKCKYPGCGKSFVQRAGLVNHERVHTGDRPYRCEECGKRFTQQGALKRHTAIHTGYRPFACTFCDKEFSRKDSRDTHVRGVHKREPPLSETQLMKRAEQIHKQRVLMARRMQQQQHQGLQQI